MSKAVVEKVESKEKSADLGPVLHITKRIEEEISKLLTVLQESLKDNNELYLTIVKKALLIGKETYSKDLTNLINESYTGSTYEVIAKRAILGQAAYELGILIHGSHNLTKPIIKSYKEDQEEHWEALRNEIEHKISEITGIELTGELEEEINE